MAHRRVGIARVLGAVVALGLLTSTAACNDDTAADKETKKTTTTAASTTTPSVTAPPESAPLIEVTTTTINPSQFGVTLESVRTELTAAGADLCKVVDAAQALSTAGSPATTDELKNLFVLYGEVFDKIAEALPADSAADATTIRAAVADMLAKAEASGYDPSTFGGGGPPGLVDNPDMVAAMGRVQGLVADCPEG